MKKLIYLEDAIDALNSLQKFNLIDKIGYMHGVGVRLKLAVQKLEQLPSAEPERKTGRWIHHPEWVADGECAYECSQCGMGSDVDYNFCMRCGSKMEVEHDG